MPDELPKPPPTEVVIKCPVNECQHGINSHNHDGCDVVVPGAAPICACLWTPNDIALYTVFGDLTRSSQPVRDPHLESIRRPLERDWS